MQSSSEPPRHFVFYFVASFLRKDAFLFFAVQLFSLVWAVDQVVFPLFFSRIIDCLADYNGERSSAWIEMKVPICTAIVMWIFIECCFRTAGVLSAKAFPTLEARIRMTLYESALSKPYSFFSSCLIGDVSHKIAAVPDSVTRALTILISFFIPSLFALTITTTTFFFISPFFAVMVFIWALAHIFVCVKKSQKCMLLSQEHTAKKHELQGKIVDSISNYVAVTTYARKTFEMFLLAKVQREELGKNCKQLLYTESVKIILGCLTLTIPGLCINGYAYHCWTLYTLSVGDIILIFSITWNLVLMVWWSGMEIPNFFKELGIIRESLLLLFSPELPKLSLKNNNSKIFQGEIKIRSLTFRHEQSLSPIFKEINIEIKKQQKVGLVGSSGSGKTTLALLLLRFFEPQQGAIFFDDCPINEMSIDDLRKQIAFIPQDPLLFHRSIIDNIAYAKADSSLDEVIVAAKKARAHDFITNLPEGYQTIIGEKGLKLSGGQRQRIAIARAILKDSPIIIFDEATSALDALTEHEIQSSLQEFCSKKTFIVIAHRLSTLTKMDRILVLQGGEIIEDGAHAELLGKGGAYSGLWHAASTAPSQESLII